MDQARNCHGEGVYVELAGVEAGASEHTYRFVHWLEHEDSPIAIDINFECARCCCKFLVEDRGYRLINAQQRCVMFGERGVTSCYVDGPQGPAGRHGVVKTGHDINLGRLSTRPVNNSHSYQFYGPPVRALAIGQDLVARLEAIAVEKVTKGSKLNNCYFSYSDITLLEKYRQANGKRSLKGKFLRPVQANGGEEIQDEEEVNEEEDEEGGSQEEDEEGGSEEEDEEGGSGGVANLVARLAGAKLEK